MTPDFDIPGHPEPRKEAHQQRAVIISGQTVTVEQLIEILKALGFEVEDYWKGTVDGRRLRVMKGAV